MVKLLRAGAFAWVVLLAIVIFRPYSEGYTFAAEPAEPAGVRVRVLDNGRTTRHVTTARSVGAFLEEEGIELHPKDNLFSNLNRRIEERLIIRIERAFYVDVTIDNEKMRVKVAPNTTAGEVFRAQQERIEDLLLFDGDEDEVLDEEASLAFVTWRSRLETIVDPIPYPSETFTTQSLSMGVEKIRQEGVMGERRVEAKIVYVGNEKYSREILNETIIEPVTKIIDKGVGGALGTLTNTGCPSFRYARRVTMNASAYTAGFSCTGRRPGDRFYRITASGREVEHGIVAVDPRIIPLGTRLYVENYGFALAADVGSAIQGYKIDLFMECIKAARRFGRRDVTVFILD